MVSLVLVSHSDPLLTALVEVVRDLTRTPPACFTAGGTDDGRLGTSLAKVRGAIRQGLDAADDGCLVLYDTGSAWLTIGFALDDLPATDRARVELSDAPLVEGTLAAAARAADGAPLAEVADAAASALSSDKQPPVANTADAVMRRTA
jgi:dihydroxyacetone kinase DhaKLM complex PTS-EIIA-like component DhaM